MKITRVSFTLFFLVLTTFGISSCDNQSETELLQEKLIGDWTSLDSCKNHASDFGYSQLLLSFEKANFRTKITGEENFVIVDKKSIYIKSTDRNGHPDWHYYKIVFLGKRFLKIKPKDQITKKHIGSQIDRPYNGETITLRKCRKRNAVLPKKIVLYASTCCGSCPSFLLEINKNRSIRYLGMGFSKKGSFTKKISKTAYRHLLNRIQQMPINRLKKEYVGCVADAQVSYINIFYGNHHVSYKLDLCEYTPPELKFMLDELMHIGTDTTGMIKARKEFHFSDFDVKNFHPISLKELPRFAPY